METIAVFVNEAAAARRILQPMLRADAPTHWVLVACPPVLTRRGADILVRVEKLLDEAAKAVPDTPPAKTTSSGVPANVADSFAAATPGNPTASAPRKN